VLKKRKMRTRIEKVDNKEENYEKVENKEDEDFQAPVETKNQETSSEVQKSRIAEKNKKKKLYSILRNKKKAKSQPESW